MHAFSDFTRFILCNKERTYNTINLTSNTAQLWSVILRDFLSNTQQIDQILCISLEQWPKITIFFN